MADHEERIHAAILGTKTSMGVNLPYNTHALVPARAGLFNLCEDELDVEPVTKVCT